MRRLFVLKTVVLMIAVSLCDACVKDGRAGAEVIVELGGHRLTIPEVNIDAAQETLLTRASPGLKKNSREINIRFSAGELEAVVGPIGASDVVGTLRALDAEELVRAKSLDHTMVDDLWLRRGRFHAYSDVASIPGSSFLRIRDPKPAVVQFWEVIRAAPSGTAPLGDVFDSWVASCNTTSADSNDGVRDGICLTHIYIGDLRFRFWIAEPMLEAIDPLRLYLSKEIAKWSLTRSSASNAG